MHRERARTEDNKRKEKMKMLKGEPEQMNACVSVD